MQRTPWLISPAGPAGVDRHVNVGVGKLSAFPFLTFGRKGISRTAYLLCLNVISNEKIASDSVPKCVLKSKEKNRASTCLQLS